MEFTTLFKAAFPSNPTHERYIFSYKSHSKQEFHLPCWNISDQLKEDYKTDYIFINHISYNQMDVDFNFELFLVHSPLLKESLLVSFPPLINMLKFSGFPSLD